MKLFDRLALRIEEALMEERLRALPPERLRALIGRLVAERKE